MKKKITIVDYGLGNIVSAQQSFLKAVKELGLKADVVISSLPSDVSGSSHIVLPGQGAFKSCIEGLKNIPGMIHALEQSVIKNKKPFLGICIGIQLLADFGFENGWIDLFPGGNFEILGIDRFCWAWKMQFQKCKF